MTNNGNVPANMYRSCPANQPDKLFPEIEQCLQAYYDLIDDCKDFPHWARKLEEDLGGSIGFLASQVDETTRDDAVAKSPIFLRYDLQKQVYFK